MRGDWVPGWVELCRTIFYVEGLLTTVPKIRPST